MYPVQGLGLTNYIFITFYVEVKVTYLGLKLSFHHITCGCEGIDIRDWN